MIEQQRRIEAGLTSDAGDTQRLAAKNAERGSSKEG